jgi:general stress protein 26
MKQPVTELETRFSDEDAVASDWEETRSVLEDAELFWISTVRADGRPHVTPLVAVWLDDAIYFATGQDEQKAVNLRSNQNVILTTGCNEWERGLDVVIEGEAVQVTDKSLLDRLAETWATKWDGALALRGTRPRLPARGWEQHGPCLLGEALKGARVRQRHLRPDAPPVLGTCTPHLMCRCSRAFARPSRRARSRERPGIRVGVGDERRRRRHLHRTRVRSAQAVWGSVDSEGAHQSRSSRLADDRASRSYVARCSHCSRVIAYSTSPSPTSATGAVIELG